MSRGRNASSGPGSQPTVGSLRPPATRYAALADRVPGRGRPGLPAAQSGRTVGGGRGALGRRFAPDGGRGPPRSWFMVGDRRGPVAVGRNRMAGDPEVATRPSSTPPPGPRPSPAPARAVGGTSSSLRPGSTGVRSLRFGTAPSPGRGRPRRDGRRGPATGRFRTPIRPGTPGWPGVSGSRDGPAPLGRGRPSVPGPGSDSNRRARPGIRRGRRCPRLRGAGSEPAAVGRPPRPVAVRRLGCRTTAGPGTWACRGRDRWGYRGRRGLAAASGDGRPDQGGSGDPASGQIRPTGDPAPGGSAGSGRSGSRRPGPGVGSVVRSAAPSCGPRTGGRAQPIGAGSASATGVVHNLGGSHTAGRRGWLDLLDRSPASV